MLILGVHFHNSLYCVAHKFVYVCVCVCVCVCVHFLISLHQIHLKKFKEL